MPREEKEPVSFDDIKCERATGKAILVEISGEEYWIPKSQIHEDSEVYDEGHEGTLIITHWIAEQKGLI